MRLVAVCAVTEPGGAEIGLLRLLDRLAPRGWEMTMAMPGPGALSDAVEHRGWPKEHLDVGGLRPGLGPRLRAVRSWPRARRLTAGATVVYLNGGACGRLLPALAGRRTVLHLHDMVARVPPIWSLADVVLADSHAVARALGTLAAEVVHCPIEPSPPEVPAPWPDDGRPVVGFVGRLEPRKGPLDLVLAAPAIRAAEPDVRIVLIGADTFGGDPDYVARVRSAEDVEHHGWVDHADGVMRHLDVLVVPSRREPFGTVAAEAMAVGTPVVASAVDGLAEVVSDGVDGALVAPGRPSELAAAVVSVLHRREEMGAAAIQSSRRFDADRYAQRVERIIAA